MLLVSCFQTEHLSVLPDFEPAVLTGRQEFPLPMTEVRPSFLSFYQRYLNKNGILRKCNFNMRLQINLFCSNVINYFLQKILLFVQPNYFIA